MKGKDYLKDIFIQTKIGICLFADTDIHIDKIVYIWIFPNCAQAGLTLEVVIVVFFFFLNGWRGRKGLEHLWQRSHRPKNQSLGERAALPSSKVSSRARKGRAALPQFLPFFFTIREPKKKGKSLNYLFIYLRWIGNSTLNFFAVQGPNFRPFLNLFIFEK